MAGFPKLPHVRGETDDDASIHLFSTVGPARPIAKRNYDQQIMSILSQPVPESSSDESLDERRLESFNRRFKDFAKSSSGWSDSDDDATQVEQDVDNESKTHRNTGTVTPIENRDNKSRNIERVSRPPKRSRISLWGPKVFGFIIGFVLLLLLSFLSVQPSKPNTSLDLTVINSRIDSIESRVSAISEVSVALDEQVDAMNSKQGSFFSTVQRDLTSMDEAIKSIKQNVSFVHPHFTKLEQDMEAIKSQIDGLRLLSDTPAELENRMIKLSHKISQLSKINSNLIDIKKDIIDEFLRQLPNHVPVYIENNKIHYLPEFHRFLLSFMEKHFSHSKQNISWQQFIEENGQDFNTYIKSLLKDTQVKFITRDDFERNLNEELSHLSENMKSNFNELLDRIDLSKNITRVNMQGAGSKVVLDNLLDIIGRGSIKVNYADYKLGSRILGFLTTTGKDSYQNKPLLRKVFLGWWDFFNSNGLRAPKNMKFNANNVLLDSGQYWECESNWCSIGLRLSSPVILTDIVLNNPSADRPSGLVLPTKVSIYIKPRKRSQATLLENYVNVMNFQDSTKNENKYLSKFYKVQEVNLKAGSSTEHIQLPVSIVNLKILVRDVYIELATKEGVTGLYNVKVYGLTELNAFKYSEQFESLLDSLAQTSATPRFVDYSTSYQEDYVLGDDDCFL